MFAPDTGELVCRIVASTMVLAVESCFALPRKKRSLAAVMRILDAHRRMLAGI